jgi:hypothetical protein
MADGAQGVSAAGETWLKGVEAERLYGCSGRTFTGDGQTNIFGAAEAQAMADLA